MAAIENVIKGKFCLNCSIFITANRAQKYCFQCGHLLQSTRVPPSAECRECRGQLEYYMAYCPGCGKQNLKNHNNPAYKPELPEFYD